MSNLFRGLSNFYRLHATGRSPKASEIAAALQLTSEQVREYLGWSRQPVSLNLAVGGEQDTELGDLLSDRATTQSDYLRQAELTEKLVELMRELPPQQRYILEQRYGLLNTELSLREIGKEFNLSRERIRQIELKSLNFLRARRSQFGQSSEVAVDVSEGVSGVQLNLF